MVEVMVDVQLDTVSLAVLSGFGVRVPSCSLRRKILSSMLSSSISELRAEPLLKPMRARSFQMETLLAQREDIRCDGLV